MPELHTHNYRGVTSYDKGHVHYYAVSTGPEMEVGGGHYHYYR